MSREVRAMNPPPRSTPTVHEMRLREAPFRAIAAGKKTIEMRLLDEKRQTLQVGDTIRFNLDTGAETVSATVVALHVYPHFEALYADLLPRLGKIALGYDEDGKANPADMLAYYSAESITLYGVVGIEIKQKANHDHGI